MECSRFISLPPTVLVVVTQIRGHVRSTGSFLPLFPIAVRAFVAYLSRGDFSPFLVWWVAVLVVDFFHPVRYLCTAFSSSLLFVGCVPSPFFPSWSGLVGLVAGFDLIDVIDGF